MLHAQNLTRRFGSRVAVEGVSFGIERGEVFALLGPNGAGKTTTLRMLAGLIAPSSGSVLIGGECLDRENAARLRGRIGFLTEASGLWDRLTVRQNLLTYARLYAVPAPTRAVEEALAMFDIGDRAGDLAAQLSKGLRQRVALARTLLHKPAIVLLDEPTSGLDPESARSVRALIVRLRDERHAVLLSTHNLDEVARVAGRVAILRTSLVAVDTPAALRARLFGRRVRIELRADAGRFAAALKKVAVVEARVDGNAISVAPPNGASSESVQAMPDTPTMVRILVEMGAEVESVVSEEASMEDLYLRLLGHESRGS